MGEPMTNESAPRAVTAMGERVVRVETKLEGVEKDTAVIRQSMHSLNNQIQGLVGIEQQCVAHLAAIREMTAHLPDLVAKMGAFEDLKPRLITVIDDHAARRGGWRAVTMLVAATTGALTMLGTVLGGVAWLFVRGH